MPDSKAENNENGMSEVSYLLQKTFNCPCCDKSFKNDVIRAGKTKQKEQDLDLRPHCYDIDPLKYGVIMCPSCGYASLAASFGKITPAQIKSIRSKVTPSFYCTGNYVAPLSYEDAINRHKLALINATHCSYKVSEKAYLILLIGWLLREQLNEYKNEVLENLNSGNSANTSVNEAVINNLTNEVNSYLKKASEGLKKAFSSESMPICGMDSNTVTYLIAALDYETGEYEEAGKWIAKLITAGRTSDRIKQRAVDLKKLIKQRVEERA